MKLTKNKHPIKLLEDLESLVKELRSLVKEKSLIIEEEGQELKYSDGSDEEEEKNKKYELLRFRFKEEGYNFIFTIDDLQLDERNKHTSRYYYYKSPQNEISTNSTQSWGTTQQVIFQFKEWLDILNRYEKIKFIDPITEKYQTEIFENLKIVDEDADSIPFETDQQIFLIQYLDKSIQYLEEKKDEYEVIEIIEEAQDLKKSVTSLPKNSSMKKLSSIFAKSKKKGMTLFKDLMVMFKKDLMKKLLTQGYKYFEDIINLFQGT